jgi:hypothetical protein
MRAAVRLSEHHTFQQAAGQIEDGGRKEERIGFCEKAKERCFRALSNHTFAAFTSKFLWLFHRDSFFHHADVRKLFSSACESFPVLLV